MYLEDFTALVSKDGSDVRVFHVVLQLGDR